MRIAFTGHRDCKTSPAVMVGLRRDYPNAVWVHGNCPRGFDKQVKNCATRWLIEQDVYPAKWKEFGRAAGMMRNADIIRGADLLVACWDGREEGGTWGTIQLAKTAGIKIIYVEAISLPATETSAH